jgi:Ca2+-binding EF-hand superfamily protein
MSRAIHLALPGLLALAFAAGAVAPPPAPVSKPAPRPAAKPAVKAAPTPDQLDFIFFGSDRPVLIRLHLQIGDKPYPTAWEAWMDRLFAWFDKNNDGTLSPAEAARLMPGQFLQNQVQGSIGGPSGQTVPFANLDTNKDGKVSKEEFRTYYRNSGFNPLRFFNQNFQARTAKQTNDAIYRHLGLKPADQLRKIDADKLAGLMARLDENEDEMLVAAELNTDGDENNPYGPVQVFNGRMMQPPMPTDPGLIQIQATTPIANLARQLLNHYDKNKDGKLTPGEGGLSPKFVAEFDVDGDGKLDMEEIKAFFRRQPDLVFRGRVGVLDAQIQGELAYLAQPTPKQRAQLLNPKTALGPTVRRINPDNLAFDLGDARFTLQANQGNFFNNRLNGVKNFYEQQFDAIVDKKKGYIERKQEKENQGNPFIFQIFTQADKNADGRLTKEEMVEWLDLVADGGNCFVTLQVNDMGRSLFDLVDHNSDGQLSLRELRTAWERIQPLCKEGKGLVQADLPRSLRVTMGLGNSYFISPFQATFYGNMGQYGARPNNSLPAWFTKMDLNRDGDISPKEWLGTDEEFKAIDTDGDGLISAEEARQYEARRKKKQDATKAAASVKQPEPPKAVPPPK